MNINPKVSVIIPVWNPGEGISRCVASLRGQTLKDIEMIFVDDCGTDGAMDVVRAAAADDPRIRIIENEKNIGAGLSRNRGIEAACGEYLSFVDPDDYVEQVFQEQLYEKAKAGALDIVKGTIIYEKEDGAIAKQDRNLNRVILMGIENETPLFRFFTYEHHSAIYRRNMLIANGVRYGNSRRSQDVTFLLSACLHTNSFALIDEARYHHCERSVSAMHTMNAGMLVAFADAFGEQVDVMLSADVRGKHVSAYLLDRIKYDFLRETLRYEMSYSSGEQTQVSDALQKSSEEMTEQIRRLPFCEELIEKSFSVRALMEYGVALPPSPYVSPWENATPLNWCAVIKKWADFLEIHPECQNACRDDVRNLLTRVDGLKSGTEVPEAETQAWKNGMKELSSEVKRLPKRMRTEACHRTRARTLILKKVKLAIKYIVG